MWCTVARGATIGLQGSLPAVPLAAEVFDAEFRAEGAVRGLAAAGRPSEQLPQVSFSRIPVDIYAVVISPSQGAAPSARLFASNRGREWDVTGAALAGADHAVCDAVWHPFRPGVLEEIGTALATAGVSLGAPLTLKQYLDLAKEARANSLVEDRVGNGAEVWSEQAPGEDWLPGSFEGVMYPYQLSGYRWLSFISDEELGGILADEMGLGKTVQIIAVLTRIAEAHRGPCLVVCPATICENWRRELLRFAPSLRVALHRGPHRTGFPKNT